MPEKYKAPAVKKAFQMLKMISDADQGLGISELAKNLKISKGTVHGITSVLEEMGVILRDPHTKRYELGLTLFELGRKAFSQINLMEFARPVMQELMEKVQETVFLGIINKKHVTILDVVECRHDFKITSPIGATIPLYAAAVGKVFLAFLDENEAKEMILTKELPRPTTKSITDPNALLEEIQRVRRMDFATDYEEYISGVRAVAAPIHALKDRLAALWVVGFKASLDDNKMELLKREITQAVKAINQRIAEHKK